MMEPKKTTDLYFAAALSALGAKLEEVDKTDPRHMVFSFSPRNQFESMPIVQNLNAIETDWANKTLVVNAVDYAESLKRLKSVIHSK